MFRVFSMGERGWREARSVVRECPLEAARRTALGGAATQMRCARQTRGRGTEFHGHMLSPLVCRRIENCAAVIVTQGGLNECVRTE